MALNRTRSKVRLSRALGIPLTPKATRHLERRPYPPGQHGRRRRTQSDYKARLLEKQRLRAQYNLGEAQLRLAMGRAVRSGQKTGESLLVDLETRLDALVLRAGFARTILAAHEEAAETAEDTTDDDDAVEEPEDTADDDDVQLEGPVLLAQLFDRGEVALLALLDQRADHECLASLAQALADALQLGARIVDDLAYRLRRAGQTWSKMRFAAAQLIFAPRSAGFVQRYGPKAVCAAGMAVVTSEGRTRRTASTRAI
jgi:hypothetical protein